MSESAAPEELVALARTIRLALREADRLGLIEEGIHLDAALNGLADRAGPELVSPEPFSLRDSG